MPAARRADPGAAAGVVALLMTMAVGALWQSRELSPLGAIFPRAIGAALLVDGAVVLWRCRRRLGTKSRGLPHEGWLRGALMVVVVAWIDLFERVGFAATGVVVIFELAMITDRDSPRPMRLLRFLVVALGVVIGFQLRFVQRLNVQLPNGTPFSPH